MNREIKFRAWDNTQMIFRNLHDRNWYTDSNGGKWVEVAHPDDNHYKKIMQFTGLKDKNGVEIYEGDIVECYHKHGGIQYNIKQKSKVEFYNYAWRLDRIFLLTEIDSIEVIGNIYENPELLK